MRKSKLTLVINPPIKVEMRVGCIQYWTTAPDAELACRELHKKYGFEVFDVEKVAGVSVNLRLEKGLARSHNNYPDAVARTKALAFNQDIRITPNANQPN